LGCLLHCCLDGFPAPLFNVGKSPIHADCLWLQIRLSGGKSVRKTFNSSDSFADVLAFACSEAGDLNILSLQQAFPRKVGAKVATRSSLLLTPAKKRPACFWRPLHANDPFPVSPLARAPGPAPLSPRRYSQPHTGTARLQSWVWLDALRWRLWWNAAALGLALARRGILPPQQWDHSGGYQSHCLR